MSEFKSARQLKAEMDAAEKEGYDKRTQKAKANSEKIKFLLEDVPVFSPFIDLFRAPLAISPNLLVGVADNVNNTSQQDYSKLDAAVEHLKKCKSQALLIYTDNANNVATTYVPGVNTFEIKNEEGDTIESQTLANSLKYSSLWEMMELAIKSMFGFTYTTGENVHAAYKKGVDHHNSQLVKVIGDGERTPEQALEMYKQLLDYWSECLSLAKETMACNCPACQEKKKNIPTMLN
jgi:hypothetical protein